MKFLNITFYSAFYPQDNKLNTPHLGDQQGLPTCKHEAGIFQFFLGNFEAEGFIIERINCAP